MVDLQCSRIASAFLVAISAIALAQSNSALTSSTGPDSQTEMAVHLPSAPSASRASTYAFPDGKQQFRNYLYSTFGPPAFISTAVGAGLDQNKPAPPEWDSGAKGYGERYGWRFGVQLVSHTTEYSLGALVHEDVAYHRCECSGFVRRSAHAFASTLTAETRSGRTVFSLPALVSPYAGSFTAMNAWYPSRYGPADASRVGSTSFMFKAAGNLVGEFLAPRR